MARDLAFWLAVALVSIAASVLVKVVAGRFGNRAFVEFAAAT